MCAHGAAGQTEHVLASRAMKLWILKCGNGCSFPPSPPHSFVVPCNFIGNKLDPYFSCCDWKVKSIAVRTPPAIMRIAEESLPDRVVSQDLLRSFAANFPHNASDKWNDQ